MIIQYWCLDTKRMVRVNTDLILVGETMKDNLVVAPVTSHAINDSYMQQELVINGDKGGRLEIGTFTRISEVV